MNRSGEVLNAMTVDVEEYFQVTAFDNVVDRQDWSFLPSRIERNVGSLLDLFDEFGVRATFFVLGWIAERHPAVVKRIADRGHEIGCHGYDHKLLYGQNREVLRRETALARTLLQDLTGQSVLGYRAASFSIGRGNFWALDVLVEAGFAYDSSLFPVVHDRYGVPGAPRHVHRVETPGGSSLLEVPPSTVVLGGLTLPFGGGGYLRILPLSVTRWALTRLNVRDRLPAVLYVHPWELDPEQPRVRAGFTTRMRHYTGIKSVKPKLSSLMREYRFGPIWDVVADVGQHPVRQSAKNAARGSCSGN
jgi:polysaccharide deacetylase family protein (PEP-CTERM system associated)